MGSDVELDEQSYGELDIDVDNFSDVELDEESDIELDNSTPGDVFVINNIFKKLMELERYEQSDVDNFSDVELDEQSDIELDNQNYGELDLDCIRTQLYSLPCVPGGECSCDTDFTSQIPEDFLNFFNMMPDDGIIIVDQDNYVYIWF